MRNRLLAAVCTAFVAASAMAVTVDVQGEVKQPGAVTLDEGARLRQAIDAAGGLAPGADSLAVEVTRACGESLKVDMTKLGPTPLLKPGDTVKVAKFDSKNYVMVAGAVANPGALPYHDGITVGELLKAAQPFDEIHPDRVRIVDSNGVKQLPEGVSEEDLYAMTLAPGEAVKVNYAAQSFSNRELLIVVIIVGLILILR